MPQMDESNFMMMSESMLESLSQQVEDSLDEDFDVEFNQGVLTISHETEGEFVINPHVATLQVWMASPISGSTHFNFIQQSGRWRSVRPPHVYLRDLLSQELSRISGRHFVFEAI